MWVGQNNTIKSTSTRSHIGLFSNSRRKHVSMLYDSMSEPDEHLSQILTELRSLTSSVKEVSDRVDRLAETVYGPPKKRSPAESGSSHWADRDNEMLDDLPPPRWDSEDGDVDRFATLSERNESLLLSAFSSTLTNSERQRIRSAFPPPRVQETRCPRLDPLFRSSAKADVKWRVSETAGLCPGRGRPVGGLVEWLRESRILVRARQPRN